MARESEGINSFISFISVIIFHKYALELPLGPEHKRNLVCRIMYIMEKLSLEILRFNMRYIKLILLLFFRFV